MGLVDPLPGVLARAVDVLRSAGVPFAVSGACGVYLRGAGEAVATMDIQVPPADAPRARDALAAAGLHPDPPEDRRVVVRDDDTRIALVFRTDYLVVTAERLARSDHLRLAGVEAPVLCATDLLVDELLIADPLQLDFTRLLYTARILRGQVDWARLDAETAGSPYARAFLGLLGDLGIRSRPAAGTGP
ncbi:hypothetical protein [Nocardia sp. NPDC020380]|uniref:hypothetical protein n=1 Tax=Nocardia sp. NPDC020380 TaxID=3364309 RepID=UPI0037A1A4EF